MSRLSGRRGLLVVLLVLLLMAAVVDLLRPGSVILGTWRSLQGRPVTPAERAIEEFQRAREVPAPRSNRVLDERSRGSISPTGASRAA